MGADSSCFPEEAGSAREHKGAVADLLHNGKRGGGGGGDKREERGTLEVGGERGQVWGLLGTFGQGTRKGRKCASTSASGRKRAPILKGRVKGTQTLLSNEMVKKKKIWGRSWDSRKTKSFTNRTKEE